MESINSWGIVALILGLAGFILRTKVSMWLIKGNALEYALIFGKRKEVFHKSKIFNWYFKFIMTFLSLVLIVVGIFTIFHIIK